jgi:hypothetical protein
MHSHTVTAAKIQITSGDVAGIVYLSSILRSYKVAKNQYGSRLLVLHTARASLDPSLVFTEGLTDLFRKVC